MKKGFVTLLVLLAFHLPGTLRADECMEGDCDNGYGTGFTDDNLIYEGEWRDGVPHGQGKLYVSKGKVLEGIWEKGKLVPEKGAEKEENSTGK